MNEIMVSQNGQIVDSSKYDWNSETKTFSTNESNLVLDFGSIGIVTIKCGNYCNINCGYSCNINCGYSCNINCGYSCNIKCGNFCNIRTHRNTTIIPERNCVLNYFYFGICECYILQEKKKSTILESGKLEIQEEKSETELQIESLKKTIEDANQKVLELQKQIQKKGTM